MRIKNYENKVENLRNNVVNLQSNYSLVVILVLVLV